MERAGAHPSKKIESHNGEETPRLPQEIITEEILPQLPLKSLWEFRCVSRSWCSLIGSERFLRNLTKPSTFPHRRIFFKTADGFMQCSLSSLCEKPFTDPVTCDVGKCRSISVVGCCNGLVCFLVDERRFMLLNPTTKKSKILPDFVNYLYLGRVMARGFGFDELNDDYKVFGMFVFADTHHSISKVYSLRSNSWTFIEPRNVYSLKNILMTGWMETRFAPYDEVGKFVNGKLHWYDYKCDAHAITFDLNSHLCGKLELPSYMKGVDSYAFHRLGVLRGCLCSHIFHPNYDLDVWLMKEYGAKESWNKLVSVRYNKEVDKYSLPIPVHMRQNFSFPIPVHVCPNGEVLLIYGLTFVIYNPESGVFRHPYVSGYTWVRFKGVYIESLDSVASDVEQQS